jgi:hypothetical protein
MQFFNPNGFHRGKKEQSGQYKLYRSWTGPKMGSPERPKAVEGYLRRKKQ